MSVALAVISLYTDEWDEKCQDLLCVGVEIIVAVFKSTLNDVKRVLEEQHQVTVHIDYFPINDDADADDTGTADTLRMMHDKIKVSSCNP